MTTSGEAPTGRLLLLRHGQTEWSRTGRHTGRSDVPLTQQGESDARAVATRLPGGPYGLVLSSPLQRAYRTAELAGLTPEIDADLMEWDYGGYEGLSTAEIREQRGDDWAVFRDGVVPGDTPGETVEEVAARASRVVARALAAMPDGDVVLVGHGHALRVLAAVYLRQEPRLAAHLLLDAGSISVLGSDREEPAIRSWNVGVA